MSPTSLESLQQATLSYAAGKQHVLLGRAARVTLYSAGDEEVSLIINPDADSDVFSGVDQIDDMFNPFRVDYYGSRSISKDGSACRITIYNLGQQLREFISGISKDKPRVILETGYDMNLEMLFGGSINLVKHKHVYPNWETEIVCDGGLGLAKRIKFRSGYNAAKTGKATSDVISQAVNDALKMLKDNGLNVSGSAKNLIDRAVAKFRTGMKGYAKGVSFDGSALDVLDTIIGKEDGAINVDNGELDIIDYETFANYGYIPVQNAYVLNSETGLVSSPEESENGGVSFTCLLLPSLRPGQIVDVNGETYMLYRVDYSGSNTNGENHATCEAKGLKQLINEMKAYKLSGIYY